MPPIRLKQVQDVFNASVTSLAELLLVPGVSQVGNEITLPNSQVIQIGGTITLPANNFITVGTGGSLVGTNQANATIIGNVAGGVLRVPGSAFCQFANLSVTNNSSGSGSTCIYFAAGGASGAASRMIENCYLQGNSCVYAESGGFGLNNCYVRVIGGGFGVFSSGIVTAVAVVGIKVVSCDFILTDGFGIGFANTCADSAITGCRFYGIDGAAGLGSPGSAGVRAAATLTNVQISENEFYQDAASVNNRGLILSSITRCQIQGNVSYVTSAVGDVNSAYFLQCSNATSCQMVANWSQENLYRVTGNAASCQFSGQGAINGLYVTGDMNQSQCFDLSGSDGYAVTLGGGAVAECNFDDLGALLACFNLLSSATRITNSTISGSRSGDHFFYYGPSVSGALVDNGTLVTGCQSSSAFISGDGTSTFPAWSAAGFPDVGSQGNMQNGSTGVGNFPLNFP